MYDNSHNSGTSPIGVMIVFDEKSFSKCEYRCFDISNSNADDYLMMSKVLDERMHNIDNKPDFILLDVGKGHLSIAKDIIGAMLFACISKGKKRNAGNETFHMTNDESFRIEGNDTLLYFLQKIRDEAHRFAIIKHRVKRDRSLHHSILD